MSEAICPNSKYDSTLIADASLLRSDGVEPVEVCQVADCGQSYYQLTEQYRIKDDTVVRADDPEASDEGTYVDPGLCKALWNSVFRNWGTEA